MIRFASILDLYREQEDDARLELGRRESERSALVQQREEHARQIAAAGRDIPMELRQNWLNWHCVETAKIADRDRQIKLAQAAIETARQALAEAHRRRTTIEKLQERDRSALHRRTERREQCQADDRSVLAYILARSSTGRR